MRKLKAALILIGALVPASLQGNKPLPLPTLAGLSTVWLGGAPKGILEYFRLELTPQGTGTLVVQYLPENAPVVYEIVGTRLDRYDVEFNIRPPKNPQYGIYLRGRATGDLNLKVGGTSLGWKRNIFLEPESTVLARIRAVTECAKQQLGSTSCRTP